MTVLAEPLVSRDYSLTGPSSKRALEIGLASAEWYHTEVPRKVIKELMTRRDGPAIRDTIIWALGQILFAAGGIYFWGSWWCVPFWAAYGVLYGSACDSRWHECGHGTAFRTAWMNDIVYNIASFQVMRNPVAWRWSHARHHTDTYIVGRDPEIAFMRPPAVVKLGARLHRHPGGLGIDGHPAPAGGGQALRRREGLHPRERALEGDPRRADPHRDLRRHHRRRPRLPLVDPADGDRPAAHLRRLAHGDVRAAAARRARRQRHRPPAEQPHGLHEPDLALHLLEHELPHRAPHVPDGALPRAAAAARAGEGRLSAAQHARSSTATSRCTAR